MKQDITLKNGQNITIESLDVSNLSSILSLQQIVISALPDKSLLQPLTEEEFLFILNGNGSMIGAFHENKLIAFRAMLVPEIDDDHLGRDAGLNEDDLSAVLYSEISNVDPAYRGNGLQQILGKLLMEIVDRKRFQYICATVAPFNIASLKDKFSLGMHIISLKVKYGNLLRYTMMKDLRIHVTDVKGKETVRVDMDDISRQQSFIEDGWIGIGIEESAGTWKVLYCKR